jgi:hypothetical protein
MIQAAYAAVVYKLNAVHRIGKQRVTNCYTKAVGTVSSTYRKQRPVVFHTDPGAESLRQVRQYSALFEHTGSEVVVSEVPLKASADTISEPPVYHVVLQ